MHEYTALIIGDAHDENREMYLQENSPVRFATRRGENRCGKPVKHKVGNSDPPDKLCVIGQRNKAQAFSFQLVNIGFKFSAIHDTTAVSSYYKL